MNKFFKYWLNTNLLAILLLVLSLPFLPYISVVDKKETSDSDIALNNQNAQPQVLSYATANEFSDVVAYRVLEASFTPTQRTRLYNTFFRIKNDTGTKKSYKVVVQEASISGITASPIFPLTATSTITLEPEASASVDVPVDRYGNTRLARFVLFILSSSN